MKCENCPLLGAYARYTIEQDIQPEDVAYQEIMSELTLTDQKKLTAMTEISEEDRRSLNVRDCPGGPRKTCFGLGRNACQANLAIFSSDKPIVPER
jgi:hypothetical protein